MPAHAPSPRPALTATPARSLAQARAGLACPILRRRCSRRSWTASSRPTSTTCRRTVREITARESSIALTSGSLGCAGWGGSLYIRPFMFGHGDKIGLGPAPLYSLCAIATPVGPYYKGGLEPIDAVVVEARELDLRPAPTPPPLTSPPPFHSLSTARRLEAWATSRPRATTRRMCSRRCRPRSAGTPSVSTSTPQRRSRRGRPTAPPR